jgi:hypothetical protein
MRWTLLCLVLLVACGPGASQEQQEAFNDLLAAPKSCKGGGKFSCPPTQTVTATVSWSANSETDLAGYRVKYGFAPGVHNTVIPVATTSQTIGPFQPGQTVYVVVTAYNTSGRESLPSTEVSKVLL